MNRSSDLSLDGIVETEVWEEEPLGACDVLIELPHGATLRRHYDALRRRLKGSFPEDLEQFFFVNTDVGSPEVGSALAKRLTERPEIGRVAVLRSLLPRTFIDCNRTAEAIGATHEEAAEAETQGKPKPMTPMLPHYVQDPRDQELLLDLHGKYQGLANRAYDEFCGESGRAVMLHTYAPRSVGIHVIDDGIVQALHEAYRPEIYETWSIRPEVDVIGEDDEGNRLVDSRWVEELIEGYRRLGVEATLNGTYRLNASTTGYHHAVRHPLRTAVVELRRDLLADPFDPFREMNISETAAERMAGPIADALVSSLEPV